MRMVVGVVAWFTISGCFEHTCKSPIAYKSVNLAQIERCVGPLSSVLLRWIESFISYRPLEILSGPGKLETCHPSNMFRIIRSGP